MLVQVSKEAGRCQALGGRVSDLRKLARCCHRTAMSMAWAWRDGPHPEIAVAVFDFFPEPWMMTTTTSMWLSACLPHDEGEMAVHEKTTPETGLTHEGKRPAGGVSPRSTVSCQAIQAPAARKDSQIVVDTSRITAKPTALAGTRLPPATTGANDGGAAQVAPQYYRVPYHVGCMGCLRSEDHDQAATQVLTAWTVCPMAWRRRSWWAGSHSKGRHDWRQTVELATLATCRLEEAAGLDSVSPSWYMERTASGACVYES